MIRFMNRRIFRVAFTLIYDFRLASENFNILSFWKRHFFGHLAFFLALLVMDPLAKTSGVVDDDFGYLTLVFGIAWIVELWASVSFGFQFQLNKIYVFWIFHLIEYMRSYRYTRCNFMNWKSINLLQITMHLFSSILLYQIPFVVPWLPSI